MMKYAFQQMRLRADSLYALISNWAEMQLLVREEGATITGYGFAPDIAEAFSALVLDWEASILLPTSSLELPAGVYELILVGAELYACREQRKFLLADGPVVVEVLSVIE